MLNFHSLKEKNKVKQHIGLITCLTMIFIFLLGSTSFGFLPIQDVLSTPQQTLPDFSPTLETRIGDKNVLACDWSPNGSQVATGGSDYVLYVWNPNTGAIIWQSFNLSDQISDIDYSPNGSLVAASTYNVGTFIFNATTGASVANTSYHGYSMEWSPDGSMLAIDLQILDSSLNHLKTMLGHSYIVVDVDWHPSLSLLASAAGDGTSRIWNVTSGNCVSVIQTADVWNREVSWSVTGSDVLVGTDNGSLIHYDYLSNSASCWTIFSDWIRTMSYSPNASMVAVGQKDVVYVGKSDTNDLNCWQKTTSFSTHVIALAWSPTGNQMLTVHWNGYVKIWDIPAITVSCPTTTYNCSVTVSDCVFNTSTTSTSGTSSSSTPAFTILIVIPAVVLMIIFRRRIKGSKNQR